MPRFVCHTKLNRLSLWPSGLDTTPGKVFWEPHRGKPYLIFIDESFYKFFGLNDPDGNFCYGVVGIPASALGFFENKMKALFEEYRIVASKSSPPFVPLEFKHSGIVKTAAAQSTVLQKLAALLRTVGGFISGFYAPTSGLIRERIRVDLVAENDAVPRSHKRLFLQAQQELVQTMTGPNQAELITRMLQFPASAMTMFLGWLEASFTIVYDPRQKKEDEIVRSAMVNYLDLVARVPYSDGSAKYLGMDISNRSELSFGLQAADLVSGLLRSFFRKNKAIVEHGATLRLITPNSTEPLVQLWEIEDRWYKIGALSASHPAIEEVLGTPNNDEPLSYFVDLLASGTISLITSTGRYRHIEIFNNLAFDLQD